MASLDRLEELLAASARTLDDAAHEIRDLNFNKQMNIRRIGELIAEISLLRNEIYLQRPDLKPDYLKS